MQCLPPRLPSELTGYFLSYGDYATFIKQEFGQRHWASGAAQDRALWRMFTKHSATLILDWK